MIETYNANRDTNIKEGKATVSFGFSADDIAPSEARLVEREIDLFLARISAPRRTATATKNFVMVPWKVEEKDMVRHAASREGAWQKFHERFPDSTRGKAAVTRWWDMYHEDKPAGSLPAPKQPEIPDPDKTGCEGCDNIGGPSGTRDPDKCDACSPPPGPKPEPVKKTARQIIKAKAKKQCTPQSQKIVEWIDLEKSTIADCKDRDAALIAYRAAFPGSKRSDDAIYQRYVILQRGKEKTVAPVQEEPDNTVSIHDKTPVSSPDADLTKGDRVQYVGSPKSFSGIGEVIKAQPGHLEVVVDIGNGRMTVNRSNLAKVAA